MLFLNNYSQKERDMNNIQKILCLLAALISMGSAYAAGDITKINNYLQYSKTFSSSGQPTAEQLKGLKNEGFKRVIYLAFSDSKTAIPIEDHLVKLMDLEYVHIPVDLAKPTLNNFEDFTAVMNRDKK